MIQGQLEFYQAKIIYLFVSYDLMKSLFRLCSQLKVLSLAASLFVRCFCVAHKMYRRMELRKYGEWKIRFDGLWGKFSLNLFFQKYLFHLFYCLLFVKVKIFCFEYPLKQLFIIFYYLEVMGNFKAS